MTRTPIIALAALAAGAAAIPASASAHTARCADQVIVTDYNYLNPVLTKNPDGSTTVVWSDGYTVTVPSCTPIPTEPTPAPEPTPPEATPQEPTPTPAPTPVPPEVTPQGPVKSPPLKAKLTRKTIRVVACKAPGSRGFRVDRITVVWTRGGKVVKKKVATVKVVGKVCRPPAVTG